MTQKEIDESILLAFYMGAKTHKEVQFNIHEYELYIPFHCIISRNDLKYTRSMDWLYPVYQKICKWISSEECDNLANKDEVAYFSLIEQHSACYDRISDGEDVSEIFKEIVSWIKLYNLKVLENDKT